MASNNSDEGLNQTPQTSSRNENSGNGLPPKFRFNKLKPFPSPPQHLDQDYYNIFCPKCGYWRNHVTPIAEHRTCICCLLQESAICCVNGYSSLIRNIPSLIFWSPVPNKYVSDGLNVPRFGQTHVRMTSGRMLDLIKHCTEIRSDTLNNLTTSINNFPIEIVNDGRCDFQPPV